MTEPHKTLAVETKRGVIIVIPQGDAIGFRNSDVQAEFHAVCERLETGDATSVVVDLGRADYFGSLVIGWIIDLGVRARKQGGTLALCNVSEQMQEFLSVMNLDDQLPQHATRKQAIKAVSS